MQKSYKIRKIEETTIKNSKRKEDFMLIIFLRAILLYIVVLIVMRLMGKREIGQMQPFELAISIMIADLAATPMAETGIPISNGIIPILGLLVMHLTISTLNIKSTKAREIICGKPSILIYRGKIFVWEEREKCQNQ